MALMLILISALPSWAQDINVTGKVTDSNNEPLIGATVMVKGTQKGVLTDLEGNYQISAPAKSTLSFSYVGYSPEEVQVNGRNKINVILIDSSKDLNEVVVVGYGEQKKVNLTGSVASVNVADLQESRPMTNITQALAGQAAGVRVTMDNNQPGDDSNTIRIRGTGTLNNAAPLVIIDGVEGGISSVNPQDIEQMSILKDAASAAIYGSRAANGVVLITTKKGSSGKVKVNYNGYVSFQSMKKNIHSVTDYATYMELVN